MNRHIAGIAIFVTLTLNVHAKQDIVIESEDQFVQDYEHQVEHVATGVYLFVNGPFEGKTVTFGEHGLRYDLAVRRARVAELQLDRAAQQEFSEWVDHMESQLARYASIGRSPGDASSLNAQSIGGLSCIYFPPFGSSPISYGGSVVVSATTEFYRDRGDGTFNWYYARARAGVDVALLPPAGVPSYPNTSVYMGAENLDTGEIVSASFLGYGYVYYFTDYLYSGPVFSHNLYAHSSVSGIGDCIGYVGISDSMP